MTIVSVVCRAASKRVPNRLVFGDSFDQPGRSSEAFWFQNKQSPSLERWQAGRLRACESHGCSGSEGGFVKASAFDRTCFGSVQAGLVSCRQCYAQNGHAIVCTIALSAMCRAASKMVPNRLLFGDSFAQPGRSSEAY